AGWARRPRHGAGAWPAAGAAGAGRWRSRLRSRREIAHPVNLVDSPRTTHYRSFCTNSAPVSSGHHEYSCPVAGIVRVRHDGMAVAVGLIVIGLVFVVDVTTCRDLSLSLFYVVGVALMVWAGSDRIGLLGV